VVAVTRRAAGDRCSFDRPFAEDFAGCPAYQSVSFMAFDSYGERRGTWLTCRHLATGDHPEQRGRYYARCSLGTAQDRVDWLASVGEARVAVVQALQQEFDAFSLPYREQLLDTKAALLASATTFGLRDDLERRLVAFREAVRGFLSERRGRFEAVGLPIEGLMDLVEAGVRAWAAGRTLGRPDGDLAGLRAFEPRFQAFLSEPADTPWRQARGEAAAIYEDAILRISRQIDPPGLRLTGTIDASNSEAVAGTLLRHLNGADRYHLDLSGVLFCDIGGLRVIIQAAQQLNDGRRLVLDGVPAHLGRVASIAEWGQYPNVVLTPAEPS
jgi:anti-anti-sigma factor